MATIEDQSKTIRARRSRDLDNRDVAILRELQANARITNAELARRVHLSPTPCLERVKRLENEGYIDRYVTLLNPRKVNAGQTVFVEVTLDRTSETRFADFAQGIERVAAVSECFMVAGGFDYLVKFRVADMEEYRRVLGEELTAIPGVAQTHSYVVMERIKETVTIQLEDSE
ncbi:MAG: Lrp/AsnC ligand binding domain-containing protein [Pseudomonadota bacterium]